MNKRIFPFLGRIVARVPLRAVLREPLFHFMVLALILVLAQQIYEKRHDRSRIVMAPQRATQLADAYRLQYGSPPDREAREALILQDLDDEVLYRSALALHLDRDDEIVRRRLVQKMRFLTEDLQAPAEPTAAQMEAYYDIHRERYRQAPRVSFSHIFFSVDARGEAGARSRAAEVRQRLSRTEQTRAPALGDSFPDNYDFVGYDIEQVERIFGRTEFSAAIFDKPAGRWVEPLRSAYGWHLLRVDGVQPESQPTLEAVKDRVRADYLKDAQSSANAASFAKLKSQFTFIREDARTP